MRTYTDKSIRRDLPKARSSKKKVLKQAKKVGNGDDVKVGIGTDADEMDQTCLLDDIIFQYHVFEGRIWFR